MRWGQDPKGSLSTLELSSLIGSITFLQTVSVAHNCIVSSRNFESEKFEFGNYSFEKPKDGKITFEVVEKEVELTKEQLLKLKFFHCFIFTVIYSAEFSFYEWLLKGEWNFGSIFKKVLAKVKKDYRNQGIFKNLRVYENIINSHDEETYMYTVPILDQKVDWAMIDSCIQHVEVKLMGMGSLSQILDLRASQLPLEFKILVRLRMIFRDRIDQKKRNTGIEKTSHLEKSEIWKITQ